MPAYTIVPAPEVKRLADAGALIVDVRTVMEHEAQQLQRPHENVPLDELDPDKFMLKRGLDSGAAVYFLCRSGMRAGAAAEKFMNAGYRNVYVIDGGIIACELSGEPVTGSPLKPTEMTARKSFIPLERQVRITAGALVALGCLLGFAVNSVFYLLSFMVGAGLVYAGITDRCGMALILTKAPWNKGSKGGSCGITKPPSVPSDSGKPGGGCA